jgi:hypothetical protein
MNTWDSEITYNLKFNFSGNIFSKDNFALLSLERSIFFENSNFNFENNLFGKSNKKIFL